MKTIEEFKFSFAHNTDRIHLNNAGVAPISRPALDAIHACSQKLYNDGFWGAGDAWNAGDATREKFARLIGAHVNQVSLYSTTATAISQVAFGLGLRPDDEVIVLDQEYPSNYYPWRVAAERTGAKLVIAQTRANLSDAAQSSALSTAASLLDAIESCITPRTRVIAVSWVQYQTGALIDLTRLANLASANGIFTCVDVIQGAGLLPFTFNESKLDAVCGGSHKWFVSPACTGFLVLKPEHVEKLEPIAVGALSFGTPDDLGSLTTPLRSNSLRFEPGSRAFLELAAFGASLDLINAVGVSAIAQEVEWLSRKLAHGLRERGYLVQAPNGARHRGSIVNFTPTHQARFKTNEAVKAELDRSTISASLRGPGVRLSPHAFNTAHEIDCVLEVLS